MSKKPSIRTVMTPFPYNIDVDAPISLAQEILDEHKFHHLLVMENGELCGVLSARDVLLSQTLQTNFIDDTPVTVRSVYSPIPYTADINADLTTVLDAMIVRNIGSVVITKNGTPSGIITTTDICKAMKELVGTKELQPDVA
jgi:acetoin utilization protein AcuB